MYAESFCVIFIHDDVIDWGSHESHSSSRYDDRDNTAGKGGGPPCGIICPVFEVFD